MAILNYSTTARNSSSTLIEGARLSGEAKGEQILTHRKTLSEFEHLLEAEPIGELQLSGFAKPIAAFSIGALRQ